MIKETGDDPTLLFTVVEADCSVTILVRPGHFPGKPDFFHSVLKLRVLPCSRDNLGPGVDRTPLVGH